MSITPGVYRHWREGDYEVVGTSRPTADPRGPILYRAKHTEIEGLTVVVREGWVHDGAPTDLVIYLGPGGPWARPTESWNSEPEPGTPRFRRIEAEPAKTPEQLRAERFGK